MLHTPIFIRSQLKVNGLLEIFTVNLLYLFDVLGQIVQSQSKILAMISAIIRSVQFSNKRFRQDFDCG